MRNLAVPAFEHHVAGLMIPLNSAGCATASESAEKQWQLFVNVVQGMLFPFVDEYFPLHAHRELTGSRDSGDPMDNAWCRAPWMNCEHDQPASRAIGTASPKDSEAVARPVDFERVNNATPPMQHPIGNVVGNRTRTRDG